ncbi:hypothetical protein FEE95_05330 [Maribacter algarum]|uniref:Uncharacterized protein n=1 Tax=Maribacter algarum (ex Zhang et al. 2020) TaxID=2578118 RepID=A0A5S3PV42_9FLAO|nr:hypothetical protein [Maribacter algarum]TMM58855.1 hypothetical protein FEE95_05330 [Maribacter algarum]
MPKILLFLLFVVLQFSCKNTSESKVSEKAANYIILGNEFIDAFYSFDDKVLKAALSNAEKSQPELLYYQKWAECGNYKLLKRGTTIQENDSTILFPVTVKDDLMAALDIQFNVTDTFRLTIKNNKISKVSTSSNDPDTYYDAKAWVQENRNDLIEVPCEGIWDGGPTPCDCIKGMLNGFGEFMEHEKAK